MEQGEQAVQAGQQEQEETEALLMAVVLPDTITQPERSKIHTPQEP